MGKQLHFFLAACVCFFSGTASGVDLPSQPLLGSALPESLQVALEKNGESSRRQDLYSDAGEFGFDTQAELNETGWNTCTYTVSIRTSCSSPRFTRDAISLVFGDVYHNEVYAPRLDDPASRAFERCSTDTFRIGGPCGTRTCYLYLYRSGRDGWTPEYVKVFYVPGDSRAAVTFIYKVPIPGGIWYGFDLCHGGAVKLPSALPSKAAARR